MNKNAKSRPVSITEANHILNLASDPGLCGELLKKAEPELLQTAAARADPWEYLLGFDSLPKDFKAFCRAARSVRNAERLARMGWGGATPRTDFGEEMKKAARSGNEVRLVKHRDTIFEAMERAKPGHLASFAPTHLKAFIEKKAADYWAKRVRREGRRMVEQAKLESMNAERIRKAYPFEWFLFTGWLRLPDGGPGLCFFSKLALANLFEFLHIKNYSPRSCAKESYKQRLRRLKLVQGPPLVRSVRQRKDGRIILIFADGMALLLRCGLKLGDVVIYARSP